MAPKPRGQSAGSAKKLDAEREAAWSSKTTKKTTEKSSGLPLGKVVAAIIFALLVALFYMPEPEIPKLDKYAKYAPSGPIPTTISIRSHGLKFSGSKAPIMLKLHGSAGDSKWMRVKPNNAKYEFPKGSDTEVSFGAEDIGELQGGQLRSLGTDGLDIKGRRSLNLTYNHVQHEIKFIDLPQRARITYFTLKKTKTSSERIFNTIKFKVMDDGDLAERAEIDAQEQAFIAQQLKDNEQFAGEEGWQDVEDEVEELLDDDDEDVEEE